MPSNSTVWDTSEFEWDEGLTMPVANADNKKLEEQIQFRQKRCTTLSKELQINEDRVSAISSHLKNVRQQLHNTLALVGARDREIETEDHASKVEAREESRLQQETEKLERELEAVKEKKNFFENNIFRQMERLEAMKTQMNWDQQALEAWLDESARKDEDAMTLAKYTRHDDVKVKELILKIEQLTDERRMKKKKLDHETNETRTVEVILDQTADEFRKAHSNRNALIGQWEKVIDQMQRRDAEIDVLASSLVNLKEGVRSREDSVEERLRFLDGEKVNNVEAEKRISVADRSTAKLRLDHQQTDADRDQFQNELDALKRTVDRTALDLETTRSDVKQIKRNVIEKTEKLEGMKEVHESLLERMQQAAETHLSAEEHALRMDERLRAENRQQEILEHQLKQARATKFSGTNELMAAQTRERDVQASIQGGHAALRNLRSKINRLDQDSIKQQEIIYNQEFGIQQLERRLARLAGEQTNDEQVALEAKIKALNGELDVKVNTHRMLQAQYKQLQEDIRHVRLSYDKSALEMGSLTSKIEELELHIDNAQRAHKKAISTKEELLVTENLLRLEVRRLRSAMLGHADNVHHLDERRLHLEAAVKERRGELVVHADMLSAQVRAADSERQQISGELHARMSGIDKLTKRYENLMVSMAPPEGEEDRSQAYYVIKAAQEKEELQRRGDELDATIRKCEREMRALENTLRLMGGRNETYRQSFNRVNENSTEMDEKHSLEEQMRAVLDKCKYKRRQIRELHGDLQTMSSSLDQLSRDHAAYTSLIGDKRSKIEHLQKDIGEQQSKLDRVSKQNSRYARDLRHAENTKSATDTERDFEVRQLRERNKQVMREIGALVHDNPEMTQAVHLHFSQAELSPPTPTSSVSSSRRTSRQSSLHSNVSSPTGSATATAGLAITAGARRQPAIVDTMLPLSQRMSPARSQHSTCSSTSSTISRISKCSSHVL